MRRGGSTAVDDAGSDLLAWRTAVGWTQTDVAARLGTTQQHLSQIETGQRPVSLELRRTMVIEPGIAAEDLGLSSGCARQLVSRDEANPQIAASRLRWRDERRWLNQHRSERRMEFGLTAYFDRLDVSEALGHELATVCLAEGLPSSAKQLRGRLPFRERNVRPADRLRAVAAFSAAHGGPG